MGGYHGRRRRRLFKHRKEMANCCLSSETRQQNSSGRNMLYAVRNIQQNVCRVAKLWENRRARGVATRRIKNSHATRHTPRTTHHAPRKRLVFLPVLADSSRRGVGWSRTRCVSPFDENETRGVCSFECTLTLTLTPCHRQCSWHTPQVATKSARCFKA